MKAQHGLDTPGPLPANPAQPGWKHGQLKWGLCGYVRWVTLSENPVLVLGGFHILEVGSLLKGGVMIFLNTGISKGK